MFLKHGDSFTSCPKTIDTLVRNVWLPILQRGADEPIPSWDSFLDRYGTLIPTLPALSLKPLTTRRLRKTLARMSSFSAAGLDCWEVSSLKALPDAFFDGLRVLCDQIESSGVWPESLSKGYLCLIPKSDSDGSPSSLRPLSILSVVYRLWASCRLEELLSWQELWAHPSQSGFRPLKECLDAWYPLALHVEQAMINGTDLAGCMLDYAKAFDLVPLHEIILPLASRVGLPSNLVHCLGNFYSHLVRFFKHPTGFGSALSSDRGIVQGCPISVVLLNLLVSIFLRLTDSEIPAVTPRAYAYDDARPIGVFLNLAGSFATVTCQRLNAKKCHLWGTSDSIRRELALLRLGHSQLDVVSDLRYLGAQFGFHHGAPVVERSQLLTSFEATVRRVACLPLSAEDRATLIAGAPIPRALHGAELTHPCDASLRKLRTCVLRSLWHGRCGRIPEILTTLFFPGHRVGPVQVCLYKPLITLRRMCLKNTLTRDVCQSIWTSRLQNPCPAIHGPMHCVANAVVQIGWSWSQFERFDRPFLPPVHWLQCSKNWFSHQVRDGLRQAQVLLAAQRCRRLAGFTYLDRHMSLILLRRLKRQAQDYAHGTLKAVLSNAIKTAVIFHKSKLVSSPVCPFCDLDVHETTSHMFEVCPRWSDIRAPFPQAFDDRLPTCTRLTGLACLEPSTIGSIRALCDQLPVASPSPANPVHDAAAQLRPSDSVTVCIACFTLDAWHPIWRRVGFCLKCSPPLPSVDVSLPLPGPEQCSKRAAALALCIALERLQSAFSVVASSLDVLSFWDKVCSKSPTPPDDDNTDLLRRVQSTLLLRPCNAPVTVRLLKNPKHSPLFCASVLSAKRAAAAHHDAAFSHAKADYDSLCSKVLARQKMLLAIVLARSRYAKEHRLLTFCKNTSASSSEAVSSQLPSAPSQRASATPSTDYLVHPDNFQGLMLRLGPFKPFSRALRFSPGEFLYDALTWYLLQLKWPDQPLESTRGITFLELAMDFEVSTAIALPGSAKRLQQSGRKRIRRGASQVVRTVFESAPSDTFLKHKIVQVGSPQRGLRYFCTACLRSGGWGDRHAFLKFSCAGKPETTAQAVRRHRMANQRKKLLQLSQDDSMPPLGERALFFSDCFRSVLAKNKPHSLEAPACLVCRALSGFSLPPSAGLLRRPILLMQSCVTSEIRIASDAFLGNALPAADQWHANWFPSYDALDVRPRPLWRPREPD